MPDSTFQLIDQASGVPSFLTLFLGLILVAVVVGPLERLFPAHRRSVGMHAIWLNVGYWFFTPMFTKALTNSILGVVILVLFTSLGRPIDSRSLDGFGPLSRQPLWLQTFEVLLLADFIDYWTHRWFHVSWAWRFHAIHHSPEEMQWLTASRLHPVNDLVTRLCQVIPIVLLGFSVKGILFVVPVLVVYVIVLHSNLKWDFGVFRYVLVSPGYHRWHHTSDEEGLDRNFAGIFPLWDLLFGTYYFPRREPKKFGVHRDPVPETLLGQLLYPFHPASVPLPGDSSSSA